MHEENLHTASIPQTDSHATPGDGTAPEAHNYSTIGDNTTPETLSRTASSNGNPSEVRENAENSDPIFIEEQQHLRDTYTTLQNLGRDLVRKMERTTAEAAADKKSMAEELAPDFATYSDAMETYADFAAMNRIIDAYNLSHDVDAEKLANVQLLLKQPYFAKVVLQYKPGEPPKELYIGNAGISDDSYRRLVVDWRSPVAEVYYNQDNGPTSYVADGRTIHTDLKLRRQFDIVQDHLNAYFDTTVAIQDALLLASLSKRRTSQMQAITATIQKEQNQVVRHKDVPALLVSGIAGSGKTSVLLQRIAYLFYQQRGSLDPREVFLITPNPVFRHYIENVLPDLGERNPEILTWNEFAAPLLPSKSGSGNMEVPLASLARIDKATTSFEFDAHDFRDISCGDVRLISADQIRKVSTKFKRVPAGPHRVTLMREELFGRLQTRLGQMASTDAAQDEVSALSLNKQLRLFNAPFDPQDEQEAKKLTLTYLTEKFADAFSALERDEWLRVDRVGMRLLNTDGFSPLEWLYLKMSLTGMGNPDAKYVMVDEVQDYTAAQLAVLARYFRRANFLLLGDPNQAITDNTATFADVRRVFEAARKQVEECHLMTSYRSTPEITNLFASLLSSEERGRISSIQRDETAPTIITCPDETTYATELRHSFAQAQKSEGLTAIIAPWRHEAKQLQALLGNDAPSLIENDGELPTQGVVLITLKLAKGLEFDQIIIPDASPRIFPDEPLARRRLYTTISRATKRITILAKETVTPLLQQYETTN